MHIDTASTWLFVPGSRPERFAKAAAAGADAVIVDLQDAVESDAKDAARSHVVDWLSAGAPVCVRINEAGTDEHERDLAALASTPPGAVMVPLAQDPTVLAQVHRRLGVPVIALVETAVGVEALADICRADGVERLAFGHLDFAADVGGAPDWDELAPVRSRIVVAARAAGLPAPIDGVTPAIGDVEAIRADVTRARRLGFGGKLCIHPAQVTEVAAAFAPTDDEVAWARRITDAVAASDRGAVRVDGAMVDAPVVKRARTILARLTEEVSA